MRKLVLIPAFALLAGAAIAQEAPKAEDGPGPNMVIEVGGHTDSVGSESSNQRLSDARATTVRQYLISRDLNPDVLVSKGYGESSPIATNDTREGRWKNRRIEFKVISN